MGNWMSLHISGTCGKEHVEPLAEFLNSDENFGPLTIWNRSSLCGINNWVSEKINVTGNAAERDYDPSDVVDQLIRAVAIAPSLNVVIHCGGDYESDQCVATIICRNGVVSRNPPQIETIPKLSEYAFMGRLLQAMKR